MSDDGGKTWSTQAPLPEEAYDLTVRKDDPDAFFALFTSGVLYSPNGGGSWTQFQTEPRPHLLRGGLAVSPGAASEGSADGLRDLSRCRVPPAGAVRGGAAITGAGHGVSCQAPAPLRRHHSAAATSCGYNAPGEVRT